MLKAQGVKIELSPLEQETCELPGRGGRLCVRVWDSFPLPKASTSQWDRKVRFRPCGGGQQLFLSAAFSLLMDL